MLTDPRLNAFSQKVAHYDGPMEKVDARPMELAIKETTAMVDAAHDVLSDLESRLMVVMVVMTPEPISATDQAPSAEPPRSHVRQAITGHAQGVERLMRRMQCIISRLEI